MKTILNPEAKTWEALFQRPTTSYKEIEPTVVEIFNEVQSKGDTAITKYSRLFDGYDANEIIVSDEEIKLAVSQIPEPLKKAIQLAKKNIETFHLAQQTSRIDCETSEGVQCWIKKTPIEKIGLYIPGGTAPLFSTILMLAVPATIAGCKEIVMCTPPGTSGTIASEILYTAQLCGIKTIFKVGGIQAIAGLSFGTESIPKVDKIFGPGNQFVTVAKQFAIQHGVAIDMPAGPSELLIFADDQADASFVAADLLSQAEHGPDSLVVLISTSPKLIDEVDVEINLQINKLDRAKIAKQAIKHCKVILVENEQIALDMINLFAPEHLIINAVNDEIIAEGVRNAGSVFLGPFSPESVGDYASGTNHTLPTNGYARNYSGVTLDSFLKTITFQKLSEKGIQSIGPAVELLAEAEGLQGHKNAVSVRLKKIAAYEV